MSADSAVTTGAVAEGEVTSAVDDGQYLIADLTCDGAWLSMPADEAPVLAEQR